MNPYAAVCLSCGVATGIYAPAPQPVVYAPVMYPPNPKDKTTSVVLVVLFGFFGWLYTYKKDAWKFWLNLGLFIVLLIPTFGWYGVVAWLWAVIDVSVRPSEWYRAYPNC
jgi:hypothetical protein